MVVTSVPQPKVQEAENMHGFAVRPTEIMQFKESLVSEGAKGELKALRKDAESLLNGFVTVSRQYKAEMTSPAEQHDLIVGEQLAIEVFQQAKLEKFNVGEYSAMLSHFSETHPLASKATIWAKCIMARNFIQAGIEKGIPIDPAFLLSANIDLALEIDLSCIRDSKETSKFRQPHFTEFLSDGMARAASMYHTAFDSLRGEDRFIVEKTVATLREVYSPNDEILLALGNENHRVKDPLGIRRNQLDGLIRGLRAEGAVWMNLDIMFDEISSVPSLPNDEAIAAKFDRESVPYLKELTAEMARAIGASDVEAIKRIPFSMRHTPKSIDAQGIADLVLVAETKDGLVPVLLVEVKNYRPKDIGEGTRYSGTHISHETDNQNSRVAAELDPTIEPKIPEKAFIHTERTGMSILSVRVPTRWTSPDESTIKTVERTISIGGRERTVSLQDMNATLETMRSHNSKATRLAFLKATTTLLRNQNIARGK